MKRAILLAWLPLIICTGCEPPSPSATEMPRDIEGMTPCTGTLVEFKQDDHLCKDEGAGIDMYFASYAKFKLTAPDAQNGRSVGIYFIPETAKELSLDKNIGNSFHFFLPNDFLKGNYGTIEDGDIRFFRKARP